MLDYEEPSLIPRSRYPIPLRDNQNVHRTTTILLILQQDRNQVSSEDPEAQVVAEAIAAFQSNNRNRVQHGMNRMSISCITMMGTRPTFCIVPITEQLSAAVESGTYPDDVTQVRKCAVGDGMQLRDGTTRVPEFRLEALKYYTLFRSFAKSHWSEFLA